MKTTIITILMLLFPVMGSGQTQEGQYMTLEYQYEQTHETVKRICLFCGKDIFELVKIEKGGNNWWGLTYIPDNGYWLNGSYYYNLDNDNTVKNIKINYNLMMCQRCFEKYGEEITEIMQDTWDKLIKSIVNEKKNIKSRKHYDQLRTESKIEQIKKEIIKAENEKKKLRQKIERLKRGEKINEEDDRFNYSDYDSTFFYNITVDTLLIIKESENMK